jgi:hypothetical protein
MSRNCLYTTTPQSPGVKPVCIPRLAAIALILVAMNGSVHAQTTCTTPDEVVRAAAAALSRNDSERLMALVRPDAQAFTLPGDPEGRRQAYLKMFANGAPARVRVLDLMTVGDLVVSHDLASLPDGRILDEVSIYRVAAGRITHDWFVSVHPRS